MKAPHTFTVGVTGHRPNRLAVGEATISARLVHVLRALRIGCRGHRRIAVSALAEGSDRLFAEVALGLGYQLQVLLPFLSADYETTFSDRMATPHYRALLARALGRQDSLGATMALTTDTLRRIGGLEALRDHLADDNVLGRRVRALGLDVTLARTVVATTVPETSFGALWRHELRWARTVRTLEPLGHAVSILQYPLIWAGLTM